MKLRSVAVAILFSASLAQAQMAMLGGDVWTEVAPAKMKSILQGMGLEVTEKPAEKSTFFNFQLSSYKVSLDSHMAFMELQLALVDKVSTVAMNEWNRTHRFTRAYMDTDGGATIEADLDFGGGVTKGTIEAFIKGFRDVIPTFAKAVLDAAGSGSGSNSVNSAAVNSGANDRPSTASSLSGGGAGILTLLEGRMSIRYDPAKWKQTPTTDAGRFELKHVRGDGYAVIIAERTAIPTDTLADVAFSNIRKQDPNARMVVKQKRRVGGVDLWFQSVEATVNGVPVTYFGYYYGGQAGAVQVLTFTGRSLVPDYEKDLMEFLNGFRVSF